MESPMFYPGCTRIPGKYHLHTDGIKDSRSLAAILAYALKLGFPSETLTVQSCVENPDRTDMVWDEGHHELNHPGDRISTTLVEPFSLQGANELVRFILGFPGVTVEMEYVIGYMDELGSHWVDGTQFSPLQLELSSANYITPVYDPIEYHLALDLEQADAVSATALMADTRQAGIMVGTWYNFQGLRLRSNRFAKFEGISELVESDYYRFHRLCAMKGYQGQTRVVAELVLGIWTSLKR